MARAVAIVAWVLACLLTDAFASKEGTFNPEMCSNLPVNGLNNKPLVEWCYKNGYVKPPAQRLNTSTPAVVRGANALVFNVQNPAGTQTGGTLAKGDDFFVGPFNFPSPLRLLGQDQPEFYISNNGPISFTSGIDAFTSTGLQSVNQPVITPFWADMDTRGTCPQNAPNCNQVIWRLSTLTDNVADLATAQNFLGTATLPEYCLIVTWFQVGYFLARNDKLNTIQAFACKYGAETAVGFLYDTIEWDAGNASGGSNGIWQGNSGAAAYGGFTNGAATGRTYYNLPGSGTNDVLNLASLTGGTAAATIPGGLQPGQWVWNTLADTGCGAFIQGGKLCGTRCLPPDQCCATPNDCPNGLQCPATGTPVAQCVECLNYGTGCCDSAGAFRPANYVCRFADPITNECKVNATCSGSSAGCPALPNKADSTACNWNSQLPPLPSASSTMATEDLTLVTPEEASRVEAMGGGNKPSKQCMAACQSGTCFRLPPAHKCCFVPRPNPNNANKPLRDWYCNNKLVKTAQAASP